MLKLIRFIFNLFVRCVLLLAGLVFFASVLMMVALFLVLWLLRAFWASLSGQPVSPWTFEFKRQTSWRRFYPAPKPKPSASRSDAEVIDVEIREVTETTEIREIKAPER